MFRNFIVTAIRIAFKQRLTTALNIFGMALGISVCMLLIMHVKYELSYDKHIPAYERIYRVTKHHLGVDGQNWAQTSPLLYHELPDFFPEIEEATRIRDIRNMSFTYHNKNDEKIQFEISGGFHADSTVFSVFGIQLTEGVASDFYTDMNSLVISETIAKKYFGDDNAVGKQLESNEVIYTVRGVMPDCPPNSHMNYTYFIPFKSLKKQMVNAGETYKNLFYSKWWSGVLNYIKLKENTSAENVLNRMDEFTIHYFTPVYDNPDEIPAKEKIDLQALKDIHLHSDLIAEIKVNGNMTYIYVFIISIIFILFVVAVNYVNMATSLALKRTKEIAVKKINGASRLLLKTQILSESFLTSVIGGILAILIIDIILPFYNSLAEQQFEIKDLLFSENIIWFLFIILGLGLLSGIYPAFFITRFNSVKALKGLKDSGNNANAFRKALLVFQFVVSVFMIFSTIGIYRQMKYFQNKNLGFQKENLVSFRVTASLSEYIYINTIAFKEEMKKLPAIKNISYCSNIVGEGLSVEVLQVLNRDEELSQHPLRIIRVDKDYIKTMGLKLIEGQDFSEDLPQTSRFIIGKLTADVLQLDDPVGWEAHPYFGNDGEIIGVIEDFHFASLHQKIEPIVLHYNMQDEMRGWTASNVLIRLNPGNIKNQLEEIQNEIKSIVPDAVVNFSFVDDYLNSLYISETKMSNLFKSFTIFTIFISCLGLFGITSYNAELKTKEIGIRKVMGASNGVLIKSLSSQFMKFIFISLLIALPLAYWFVKKWMQNFEFYTNISLISWLVAIISSIIIVYITVIFHAIRIVHKKPVDILKYE